jgi:hypothetical protein
MPRVITRDRFHVVGGCWEWIGAKTGGYGVVRVARKNLRAHRVSYEESVGPIPCGLVVMHTCDNRACVKPAHLRVGTKKENSMDMVAKGRNKAPNRGLTDAQVAVIRRRLRRQFRGVVAAVAREFGICESRVRAIRDGRAYAGAL